MANIDVKSDVTGIVFEVLVKPGDQVNEGDTLLVLESMKMQIQVTTLDAGTVAAVHVKEGDMVEEGQAIVILQA